MFRPAYATPKVLEKAGVSLKDIDVWEVHEAFAVSNFYRQSLTYVQRSKKSFYFLIDSFMVTMQLPCSAV